MVARACLVTLCCLVLLHTVHSVAAKKAFPFKVLSILPSSTNTGQPQYLSGKTPLTVVFSLPVIRLGMQVIFGS